MDESARNDMESATLDFFWGFWTLRDLMLRLGFGPSEIPKEIEGSRADALEGLMGAGTQAAS